MTYLGRWRLPGRETLIGGRVHIFTRLAIWWLCKQLRQDQGYWVSWRANIAMAFKDEARRQGLLKKPSRWALHGVANAAAHNFLYQLTR